MKFEKSLCLAALKLPTWKKGVWGWECTGCEHSVLSERGSGEGRRSRSLTSRELFGYHHHAGEALQVTHQGTPPGI